MVTTDADTKSTAQYTIARTRGRSSLVAPYCLTACSCVSGYCVCSCVASGATIFRDCADRFADSITRDVWRAAALSNTSSSSPSITFLLLLPEARLTPSSLIRVKPFVFPLILGGAHRTFLAWLIPDSSPGSSIVNRQRLSKYALANNRTPEEPRRF